MAVVVRKRSRSGRCLFVEPLESREFCAAQTIGVLPIFAGGGLKGRAEFHRAPWKAATAAATPAVGLTAPTVSLDKATATAIQLSASPASGGTPVSGYSYQWYRGTTAGFVPSSTNAIAGANGLTLTDSANLQPGVPYFYVLGASDGTSSVYSKQVIAGLWLPTAPLALPYHGDGLFVAYIGSSTWAINTASGQVPSQIDGQLRTAYPNATMSMFNGAQSGQTTTSFLPGNYYNGLVKSAVIAASGYKVLRLMIGSNDAANNVPLSSWLTNMQAIINDALTWPVDAIVVEEIGVRLDRGDATLDLIRQYNAARSNLVSLSPKVMLGTAHTYVNQADHLSTLSGDHVHQNDAGQQMLAADQATELGNLFNNVRPAATNWSVDATGTIITATLSEPVVAASGTGGFTLTGTRAAIAQWSAAGTTLTIQLQAEVLRWETVSISGAAGTVEDANGNGMDAFDGVAVSNQSLYGFLRPKRV